MWFGQDGLHSCGLAACAEVEAAGQCPEAQLKPEQSSPKGCAAGVAFGITGRQQSRDCCLSTSHLPIAPLTVTGLHCPELVCDGMALAWPHDWLNQDVCPDNATKTLQDTSCCQIQPDMFPIRELSSVTQCGMWPWGALSRSSEELSHDHHQPTSCRPPPTSSLQPPQTSHQPTSSDIIMLLDQVLQDAEQL